jgi:sugar O-acyltransferase (sialic acid O-acetyltransferase NeuD family)
MNHLLIIGARGFGREIYQTVTITKPYQNKELDVKGFLDGDDSVLEGINGSWPRIIDSVENYEVQPNDVFFCAMGESKWRKHYSDIIKSKGGRFISVFHPTAIISSAALFGEGCFVGPFCCISPNVSIGDHVIIHAFSNLGHDVSVGCYSTLEAYVFMGGGASMGELSTMHTRSSIIPHKVIGREATVGIGSVVIRNVPDGVLVFGNPAAKLKL